MAITHEEILKTLSSFDCKSIHCVDKVILYKLAKKSEMLFYLERKAARPKLVLHPAMQIYDDVLSAISGVSRHSSFYFNHDMTRFPEEINKGYKPTHYGVGYNFDNRLAVEEFLKVLSKITYETIILA